MKQPRREKVPLETQLGQLAMQFRSNRDEGERSAVAACYERVVEQLIRREEKWEEMPTFEDMLPDEWMPESFFTFWSIPSPHGRDPAERPLTLSITYPLFCVKEGKVTC